MTFDPAESRRICELDAQGHSVAGFVEHARTALPRTLDHIEDLTYTIDCQKDRIAELERVLTARLLATPVALTRRLHEVMAERDAALAANARVRELHVAVPVQFKRGGEPAAKVECEFCHYTYPCPTIRALDGKEIQP